MEFVCAQKRLHLLDVVVCACHDRDHHDLARTYPERPFAAEMLRQNADEAFKTAVDGPVNDDGADVTLFRASTIGIRSRCIIIRLI